VTLEVVVDAIVVALVVVAGAVIRQLWRLGERVARLEGSSRLERIERDR
jgi:hypothetical protein